MTSRQKSIYNSRLALPALVALSCIVYYPLFGAGFVTDFLGWMNCYAIGTAYFELHDCFSIQGLFYLPFTILYLTTSIFGYHPLPWYLLFAGLHGINAWLVLKLVREIIALFNIETVKYIPFAAAILFLFNPYQVEVVAWKACINYLTACGLLLATVICYSRYLRKREIKFLWGAIGAFFLSIFTVEFFFMTPFILVLLHLTYRTKINIREITGVIPFFAIIGIYILLTRVVLARYVGHYDIDTTALHPAFMMSAELKYAIKTLVFLRFWDYQFQDKVYGFLSSPLVGYVGIGFIVLFVVFYLARKNVLSQEFRFNTFLFGSAALLIVPVAHLYFYYIQYSENDRYTYLALAFLAGGLSMVLLQKKKILLQSIFWLYLVTSIACTLEMNRHWQVSTSVYNKLIDTFNWTAAPEVFILNLPDNYKGVFMFRNIGADSAFEEAVELERNIETGKIYDVMQYNMASPDDGVSTEFTDTSTIKVTFNQWGNWWWRNGIGASVRDNDKFRAVPAGQSYTLELRDVADGAVFVYFDGSEWRELTSL